MALSAAHETQVFGIGFLDLPDKVRQHIYIEAGIPYRSHVTIAEYGMARLGASLEYGPAPKGYHNILSLLLVSRFVSKEVQHIVFSENTILSQSGSPEDLHTLALLPANAFTST